VLRETTSRSLCGLVCPSRTNERGGGTVRCFYYCSTYYKDVRVCMGEGTMEDMYYEGLRAEACVD
jgi:hypothetical protein